MSKYNVGDKVRVLKVDIWAAPDHTIDKTGRVTRVIDPAKNNGTEGVRVDLDDSMGAWNYTDEELELVLVREYYLYNKTKGYILNGPSLKTEEECLKYAVDYPEFEYQMLQPVFNIKPKKTVVEYECVPIDKA